MPHQPIEKRFVPIRLGAAQTMQSPDNAQLVHRKEMMQAEETAGQVQRGGQRAGAETAYPSIGCDEPENGLPLEQVSNADHAAKVSEIGATSHADMLTRIDRLSAGGIGEGAGPSAQPLPRFEQRHGESALSQ